MKVFTAFLFAVTLSAAPAAASDPLSSLRFFVGTWNCSYHAGKMRTAYRATYSYDLHGNWLRESDTSAGGVSDFGMITYEPKGRAWTVVVLGNDRSTVVFRGSGANPNHIIYRSVYPDASMTDIFQRNAPNRYTLQFTQKLSRTSVRSNDVCVKV